MVICIQRVSQVVSLMLAGNFPQRITLSVISSTEECIVIPYNDFVIPSTEDCIVLPFTKHYIAQELQCNLL